MLDILFTDENHYLNDQQQELLIDLLNFASHQLYPEDQIEMSLTIVSNADIQQINRDYRGKDQVTDVISFAIEDQGEGEMAIFGLPDDLPREIGDLFIAYERAVDQAKDYGHSLDRELGFLALHGFLHLNGYDHMTPADEKEMFGLQKELLDAYGLTRAD
ncbi:rRNA maturation factor [Aerococcus urinaehominis]|uniref:Endoribonuclease YbeY n=1 Tax=Aerococcus urinaehominis TaxID=128944 RepID=A0A0X8FJL9_9LACT|nr:rRNA maturation RNase YbeY [Aerococcus urinaehominis]AMB98522.1 rRNA maturation factor [Aerococcus urinaehominis]SDL79627.1 probable rRNA maturation factor [Aerococcus urinaehominis]